MASLGSRRSYFWRKKNFFILNTREIEPLIFELKTQLDCDAARLRSRDKRMTQLELQIKCEKLSVHPDPLRTFNFEILLLKALQKVLFKILIERLTREFEKSLLGLPLNGYKRKSFVLSIQE